MSNTHLIYGSSFRIKCLIFLNEIETNLNTIKLNYYEKKNEQIGDMTRLFKKLAKELDCAVVLLCQLNRDAEGEIPTMSHLKDSGDVEQDADLIIFPRIFKDPSGIECAEAIIGKNRNGPKGTAGLIWQGETASYESIPNMAI